MRLITMGAGPTLRISGFGFPNRCEPIPLIRRPWSRSFLSVSSVAWVPLGPGDPYSSWYYDPNWQPVYLNRTNVIQERIVNINVPGAVMGVQSRDFSRVLDRTWIERVRSQTVTRLRPVVDPPTNDSFRRTSV